MFAPNLGVFEDPATGSASGPLGCYLVQHGCVAGEAARHIVSTQGVKMGRASRIHVSIGGAAGAIEDVRVGGEAVLVARGELLVR
jgi:trans-2,3-dihydro-3-hydroxyanthranilate isomerase